MITAKLGYDYTTKSYYDDTSGETIDAFPTYADKSTPVRYIVTDDDLTRFTPQMFKDMMTDFSDLIYSAINANITTYIRNRLLKGFEKYVTEVLGNKHPEIVSDIFAAAELDDNDTNLQNIEKYLHYILTYYSRNPKKFLKDAIGNDDIISTMIKNVYNDIIHTYQPILDVYDILNDAKDGNSITKDELDLLFYDTQFPHSFIKMTDLVPYFEKELQDYDWKEVYADMLIDIDTYNMQKYFKTEY